MSNTAFLGSMGGCLLDLNPFGCLTMFEVSLAVLFTAIVLLIVAIILVPKEERELK